MARKLKTFTTSAGFFDLAVAAPSMKAALDAWGSKANLFHQGFARTSDDPAIVAATMAKPGVVLRRPVGTNSPFSEHAELPSTLAAGKAKATSPPKRGTKSKLPPKPVDEKAARQAALAFEREEQRRKRQEQKEEALREKAHERRERAIAAAASALEDAEREHRAKVEEIDKARAALDRQLQAEDGRWRKKQEQLEDALRRARSPDYLKLV